MRIETLMSRYQLIKRWTYFPLHPETPPEGQTLEDLFAGRDFDLEAAQERLRLLMEQEGLPYGNRSMTYNSRLAQELAKWAKSIGEEERLHHALNQAYYVEGLNLAQPKILLHIVEQLGLPVDAAQQALDNRTFQGEVDHDWQRSRQFRVTGIPTFTAGQYMMSGAQPYEWLEKLVQQAGAPPREEPPTP